MADSELARPKTDTTICSNCGKPIKLERYWQRFCSAACRAGYHKAEAKEALEAHRAAKIQFAADSVK